MTARALATFLNLRAASVRSPSVEELLSSDIQNPVHLAAETKKVGGWITALFLVGWSAGGFIFGILGDRLGAYPHYDHYDLDLRGIYGTR